MKIYLEIKRIFKSSSLYWYKRRPLYLNFLLERLFRIYIDVKVKEKMNKIKMTRKHWFPVNQAWFDQECKVIYS